MGFDRRRNMWIYYNIIILYIIYIIFFICLIIGNQTYEELAGTFSLLGVMDLCTRLSTKNRGIIRASIEALIAKEDVATQRLLEVSR